VETLDADRIVRTPSQPVLRRPHARVRKIGEVRLPVAGPYRPRARLYLFPDGRLLWHVRLWEFDRPVAHLFRTDALRTFARINDLRGTLAEIDALYGRAMAELGRASY
jgi:hypothetical protein